MSTLGKPSRGLLLDQAAFSATSGDNSFVRYHRISIKSLFSSCPEGPGSMCASDSPQQYPSLPFCYRVCAEWISPTQAVLMHQNISYVGCMFGEDILLKKNQSAG